MPDAKLDSAAVSDALQRSAVVAVLRAPSVDTALHAIEALVRGGLTAIEVTYSTPNVPFVLSRVRDIHERLTHGVGTVTEAWQVEESVAAGAQFIVSPGIDDAVIAAMHASGRTAVVGAITPSEIMRARQAGMSLVKIFPASLGGPAYLRALREPFPDLRAIPTGGVSAGNLADWFEAGAFAVGASGQLCPQNLLRAGDYDAIYRNAVAFTEAVARVRSG